MIPFSPQRIGVRSARARRSTDVHPADDFSLPNGSVGVGFVVFDATQAGRATANIKPPAVPQTLPKKQFNPATDY